MRCPLLPDPRALRCERIQIDGDEFRLFVVSIAPTSHGPCCGVPSSRVHSRYLRCTKKKGSCSQPYLREDRMTEQVSQGLASVALTPDDADWMLARLHQTQARERRAADAASVEIRGELAGLDAKEQRLKASYLDGFLTLDEFRFEKNQFVEKRRSLKERLKSDWLRSSRIKPIGSNRWPVS